MCSHSVSYSKNMTQFYAVKCSENYGTVFWEVRRPAARYSHETTAKNNRNIHWTSLDTSAVSETAHKDYHTIRTSTERHISYASNKKALMDISSANRQLTLQAHSQTDFYRRWFDSTPQTFTDAPRTSGEYWQPSRVVQSKAPSSGVRRLQPPLVKKRRVLCNSRPCYQDC